MAVSQATSVTPWGKHEDRSLQSRLIYKKKINNFLLFLTLHVHFDDLRTNVYQKKRSKEQNKVAAVMYRVNFVPKTNQKKLSICSWLLMGHHKAFVICVEVKAASNNHHVGIYSVCSLHRNEHALMHDGIWDSNSLFLNSFDACSEASWDMDIKRLL